MPRIAVLAGVFFLVNMAWGSLSFELKSDKQIYSINEAIYLKVSLKNQGTDAIKITSPFSYLYIILITDPMGDTYHAHRKVLSPYFAIEYENLKPQEKKELDIVLYNSSFCNFPNEGKYLLKACYCSVNNPNCDGLESNELAVKIVYPSYEFDKQLVISQDRPEAGMIKSRNYCCFMSHAGDFQEATKWEQDDRGEKVFFPYARYSIEQRTPRKFQNKQTLWIKPCSLNPFFHLVDEISYINQREYMDNYLHLARFSFNNLMDKHELKKMYFNRRIEEREKTKWWENKGF